MEALARISAAAGSFSIAFTSIENLIGGNQDDTFVFGASGGVDGLVDAGPADAEADPQPVDTLDSRKVEQHIPFASGHILGNPVHQEPAFQ